MGDKQVEISEDTQKDKSELDEELAKYDGQLREFYDDPAIDCKFWNDKNYSKKTIAEFYNNELKKPDYILWCGKEWKKDEFRASICSPQCMGYRKIKINTAFHPDQPTAVSDVAKKILNDPKYIKSQMMKSSQDKPKQ